MPSSNARGYTVSMHQNISVGLDIGGHQIKCLVMSMHSDQEKQTLGLGLAHSEGIRRGVVVDIERAAAAIKQAVDEAERISGHHISDVAVTISGDHLSVKNSHGLIAANGPNQQIDRHDLDRVEEAATVVQTPQNTEIIHVVPRSYRLDGQSEIKDPVGMSGVRLEVDALLVTVSTPMLRNLEQALRLADLNPVQIFANGIPAAHVAIDDEHREVGSCLVDIGHTTTTVAVYEEEELLHLAVLPVGASHVGHDLAIGLKTDLSTAQYIAEHHVDASKEAAVSKQLRIKNKSQESVGFDQAFINEIATERICEIFELVQKELVNCKKAGQLPGGLILVGGGANTPGIIERAENIVQLPVEIATLPAYEGAVDKLDVPQNASVIGLGVLSNLETVSTKSAGRSVSLPRLGGKLRNFFEHLKP